MPKKQNRRFVKNITIASGFAVVLVVGVVLAVWLRNQHNQFITYQQFGIPMPVGYTIHGIDVSRYQERINWEAVKKMEVASIKIGFAFIKATEGMRNTDPRFKRNWRESREAGVVRGAYHFFIATKDGAAQARNFIKTVDLQNGDLPPVLDVEKTFGLPGAAIRKEVQAWCQAIEAHYGVKPIIYTGADFYKNYLQGYFDDHVLWVAHYLQQHQPRISRDWAFWQHSETGRVNGIWGKVDFNVFNGDSAAFNALLLP